MGSLTMETDNCDQLATYLESLDRADNFGNPKVYEPIELNVRWENTSRMVLDPQRNPIQIDAVVVVDQRIPNNSILWLGALTEFGEPYRDLVRVAFSSEVPDIKQVNVRRRVFCVKYSDALPTIVTVGTGSA